MANRSLYRSSRAATEQEPLLIQALPIVLNLSQFVTPQPDIRILYTGPVPNKNLEIGLRHFKCVQLERLPSISALEARMRTVTESAIAIVAAEQQEEKVLVQHVREVERVNNSQSDVPLRTIICLGPHASPSLIHKIRSFGSEGLPFTSDDPAIEPFVDYFVWELINQHERLPKIRVLFPNSDEATVLLVGRLSETELVYRGKVLNLFEALDRRWRTKRYLADHADIALGTVNEYMKRLRDEFNFKRRYAGVGLTAKNVFQSRKISGVWVYRLMATVIK